MKNDLTEIVTILDRSGSMASIIHESIGGINAFMQEQRKLPGQARLSIVLFDHEYLLLRDCVPIGDVPDLDAATYVPRGMTALYDAVGKAIDGMGWQLDHTPESERPGKVIFCILTDGLENASKEYAHDRVAEMIKHQQEKYGWDFIFLGANMDAPAVAAALNIPAANSATFEASAAGTRDAYSRMTRVTSSLRSR